MAERSDLPAHISIFPHFNVYAPTPREKVTPMNEQGICYWSDYSLGQKVFVGEDDLILGRVTGIMLRSGDTQVEVSWMHNGALQCVWCSPLILRSAL